ncbi:MAG: energy transducer TonB [FCB group bacterium]|nr:energy transducer TonB [FCB group bacterium]
MRKNSKITAVATMAVLLVLSSFGFIAAEKSNPAMIKPPKPMIKPEVISKVKPEYPAEAKKKGLEGVVTLAIMVDAKGKVTELKVKSSSGIEAMDKAAIKAGWATNYKPAIQEGQPVATWVVYDVKFALDDEPCPGEGDSKYPAMDDFVAVERMPELIHQVEPEYPAKAKKQGIEGTVIIKSLIDKEGNTVKAIVAKSSGTASLDDAAQKAAMNYRYKPALQNEQPVAIWVAFSVNFTLAEKSSSKGDSG